MMIAIAVLRRVAVFTILLEGAAAFALPSDLRLLSLVPPDSQIVAGAFAPSHDHGRGNFLIFARANTLDLEDFFSLVGGDKSFEIHQVIFAASARDHGVEHSLLASGRFHLDGILALQRAGSTSSYRGIDVMVVHPFERERAFFREDRLLAIINSSLAVFGTFQSVKVEIDRFLNGTSVDAAITQRLGLLRNEDVTWCLILSLEISAEILHAFRTLDPAFGNIGRSSASLLFGIRYGRQVEFEYVVDALQDNARHAPVQPNERLFAPIATSFASTSSVMPSVPDSRHVVWIPKARYEKWLAGLTQH